MAAYLVFCVGLLLFLLISFLVQQKVPHSIFLFVCLPFVSPAGVGGSS